MGAPQGLGRGPRAYKSGARAGRGISVLCSRSQSLLNMLKLVLVVLAILAAVSAQYVAPYYGNYYRSAAVAYPYSYGSYAYGGAYAPAYYGGYGYYK